MNSMDAAFDLPSGMYEIIKIKGNVLTVRMKEENKFNAFEVLLNAPGECLLDEEMEGLRVGESFLVFGGEYIFKVSDPDIKTQEEILEELEQLHEQIDELGRYDLRDPDIQEEIIEIRGQIKALCFVLGLKYSPELYFADYF